MKLLQRLGIGKNHLENQPYQAQKESMRGFAGGSLAGRVVLKLDKAILLSKLKSTCY